MSFNLTSLLCSFRYTNPKFVNVIRLLKTSSVSNGLFHESDPKSGYGKKNLRKNIPKIELIRDGLKELRNEVALWTSEVKERLISDPVLLYRPGETDVIWNFKGNECLDKWVTTSDSDHNEGYSSCNLTISTHGKGVFSGELNTRVPKDGNVKRAGYCNMRTKRARKSFKRESYLDWTPYNALVMRVRGDGRTYLINLSIMGYFDMLWNDIYCYALYTRGGPYWQYVKGRIQDRQEPIHLDRISHFGFTLGDKINGPFSLEIDYIGLEFDPNITEEFAYEMYETGKYIVAH